MQGYNCILVYNQWKDKILFCKRKKDPYKGLYNFVGGKIESKEDGFEAAYRELEEETGIIKDDIELLHMMDFTYYNQDCYVEVYVGQLEKEPCLREEQHPLYWLDVNENFFDMSRFAGEGNIGHMVEQAKQFGYGIGKIVPQSEKVNKIDSRGLCLGIDGCKGGWIVAAINNGKLSIDKLNTFSSIINKYPEYDELLIDMVLGLPSHKEHIRPDGYGRKIIKERSSTIFPVPCRQAVYAENIAKAYDENVRVLGKKFTPLTVGIIPKMLEIDRFLQENTQYKNIVKESHPEVCFARLHGSTVMSKKSTEEGMEERISILSKCLPTIDRNEIVVTAKRFRCNVDDILDAICLAVTANLVMQGKYEVIPEEPMRDETGILMQMVIPQEDHTP